MGIQQAETPVIVDFPDQNHHYRLVVTKSPHDAGSALILAKNSSPKRDWTSGTLHSTSLEHHGLNHMTKGPGLRKIWYIIINNNF